MSFEQVVQDLVNAKRYILEHGWCQGTFEDFSGRVCVMGAVDKIGRYDYNYSRVLEATRALESMTPGRLLASFNDDARTTEQDILDLFDRTIEAWSGNE